MIHAKKSRILYPRRPPCTPFENSLQKSHFSTFRKKYKQKSISGSFGWSCIQRVKKFGSSIFNNPTFKNTCSLTFLFFQSSSPWSHHQYCKNTAYTYTKVSVLSCLGPTGQQKRKTFSVCSAYSWEFSPLLNHWHFLDQRLLGSVFDVSNFPYILCMTVIITIPILLFFCKEVCKMVGLGGVISLHYHFL